MLLWCVVALLTNAAAGDGAVDSKTAAASLEALRALLEAVARANDAPTYAHRVTQHQTAGAAAAAGAADPVAVDSAVEGLRDALTGHSGGADKTNAPNSQPDDAATDPNRPTQNQAAAAAAAAEAAARRLQRQREINQQLQLLQKRIDAPTVRDCSDLPAGTPRGVHVLYPGLQTGGVPALCHDGWTVLQRRADIQPRQDFFVGWQPYKWGFGSLAGEFWWGLQHMWRLTAPLDRRYELRIELEDFEGNRRHAIYQGFRISPEEDGYRLTAANYTGDAGDSLNYHSGQRFSTKDRDQDAYEKNCARVYKGAWWYKDCHESNLNGRYLIGKQPVTARGTTIGATAVVWYYWKGGSYSLKTVEMKIRPTAKLSSD